jgi:hypothetical protein
MLIVALVLGWIAFQIVFLVGWSRSHVRVRQVSGIDEAAYVNGYEPSLVAV